MLQVTESLAIGNASKEAELKTVREKGYQTLIDLCPSSEGNKLDENLVTSQGLQYVNVPVNPKNLSEEVLDTFKQTLAQYPSPTYVRCASGLRAAVLTLLTLADQQQWSQAEYEQKLASLGLQHRPNCPLKEFVQQHFEKRGM